MPYKKHEFRVGDEVYDTWWPYNKGKVIEVLRTRVKVKFLMVKKPITYDLAHCKFLQKVEK